MTAQFKYEILTRSDNTRHHATRYKPESMASQMRPSAAASTVSPGSTWIMATGGSTGVRKNSISRDTV